MNIILSIFFLLLIVFSIFEKKHKILVFLIILSVFTDVFSFNVGPTLHLVNVIGFLVIPLVIRFYTNQSFAYITKRAKNIIRPLWFNFFYLIILGFIFGFLTPWEDTGNYRTWAQQSQGRTIITLVRYLNELCMALYFIWAILTDKINIRFIITAIGWITFVSFLVGIFEYVIGFPVLRSLIQEQPKLLTERFLGLCGEPKSFGRNAALAYIITLAYYLKIEKNKKLLFFIIINTLTVILSMSASTFILFAMFNIYILIASRKLQLLILILPLAFGGYFAISENPLFQETKTKMDKALFGSDSEDNYSNGTDDGAMGVVSRFDIFDHLAYVFLLNNPSYIITGTGPNLISLPASRYVNDYPNYRTYAETGGIDSVPNVMFNNVLAASGILGILLYTWFFIRIYRFSNIDKSGLCKNLVIIMLIFNMVYFSIVLMFTTSIIVGLVCKQLLANRQLSRKRFLTDRDILRNI